MLLPGVEVIAFDLDDTLTDWWTGIERAAAACGDPEIVARVESGAWVHRDGHIVNRHHWRALHEPLEFMPPERVDAFRAALDPPLYDDVVPALEALAMNTRLALLTNNPFGTDVLERHGLHADVFECVVIANDVRKPDPRAFAPLIDALACAPADIAYVGDSVIADVEGSLAAGLRTVWLDRWHDTWEPPPGVVRIHSLLELA